MKKPDIRRQEIMDGALSVFLRKGYDKTTISDIAAQLGISQGLCYRYFASKEEIYQAVLDAYADMIAGEDLKNRPEHQSIRQWVDSIPHMLMGMINAERDDSQLYALLHTPQNERLHRELCVKVGEKLLPAVTATLEQAAAAGEIHIVDCRAAAAFGIFGEIGLLITAGADAGDAIKENWLRLLEIK